MGNTNPVRPAGHTDKYTFFNRTGRGPGKMIQSVRPDKSYVFESYTGGVKMGGGRWKREDFARYSASHGRSVREDGHIDTSGMRGAQDMYRARSLDPDLDPFKVVRECCDNDEHPETVPVILALDVTGSMGGACLKTAASLNVIMQNILDQYSDVEFLVMGIGDLAYDHAPIQMSQFESDIRIAEHLDKIWFERGGGGNKYESYTAAWYMGLHHTSLDCWKRGKKGIIITMGDEPLNPFLPAKRLAQITGDHLQADVETAELYREALEKFEIFHIAIDDREDCYSHYRNDIRKSFGRLLKKRFRISTLDSLPRTILECLKESGVGRHDPVKEQKAKMEEVSWSTDPGQDQADDSEDTVRPADVSYDTDCDHTGTVKGSDGTVSNKGGGAGGLFGIFSGLGTARW